MECPPPRRPSLPRPAAKDEFDALDPPTRYILVACGLNDAALSVVNRTAILYAATGFRDQRMACM
jgi:hypothetical protein